AVLAPTTPRTSSRCSIGVDRRWHATPSRYLITGATGFVGSHLAEACVKRGHAVSTIARATSDTSRLDQLGITIHRGDLKDEAVVRHAGEGADVVVHCAAKGGDWGSGEEYRAIKVDALRGLLEACRGP